MISSTGNKQVKLINALIKKSKTRREEGLFVAEGARLYAEIPEAMIHSVYVSESYRKEAPDFLSAGGTEVTVVTDDVFKAMSDTRSPQGILALVRQQEYTLDEVIRARDRPVQLLIMERIQDPGNLGTMIRTAEGAGVTGIIMDDDSADIYNPKVIRSTMGSVFRMPFLYVGNLPETLSMVKQAGICLYAAHLKGRNNYEREDYTGNIGFLIGNEASGLSDEIAGLADIWIKIPIAGQVESLNAAVAASVLMFEAARQRRSFCDIL